MDFYDVVGHVVELLQRQKRVSYRALKRQFDLDDAYLEDLKDAILFAHPVVDEDGRGLVWTGETGNAPEPTSQLTQPEPQPVVEPAQPVQEASLPVESHTPEAERRQLTVMFCDLVDSTSLSGELDPEDYRDVVRQYQQVCSEVIQRYDGHIAQLLGDGLLVYFGYPVAHEEDAQRAIHTGLGIIQTLQTLNTRLTQEKGVRLAVRLGIHTGLVVVGDMGGEGRQEQLALGETPNVASRIQGLAEANSVVISDSTYRLIQGYFDCQELGEQTLRGVSQPIVVYRVFQESGAQSRLDIASIRGLTPLVGREQEVGLLIDRWEQAKDGNGQVVRLSGEAGIGKSRLVQVIKDHVADESHIRMECRSSPYFTNSALYPITDFLQRTMRFQTDGTPEQKLEKLEQNLSQYRLPLEETVPLFGALLSLLVPEDRYPPLSWTPQRQRQKTLEAIVTIVLEQAEQQPVLFILEDLHWTDPSTLEFIELLVDQTPTASVYALLTCRPEFQPTWSHRSYLTEMTVNRLSQSQVEQLATQVSGGKTLPGAVIEQLVERTDGVPLYVEEMTKAVLESGVLKETNGHYELVGSVASLAIPATLQDSLMSRLDRLMTAKVVAQLGATIGRQFGYELLHAVAQLDEPILQRELGRLVEAELVYQRGLPPSATYTFKHALIQDIAYESLLRSTRQGYHRRIAEVLEEQFPETAEVQPELVAHHFTEAGFNEKAIGYWQRAGEVAKQRSAHTEAIHHFTKGLEVVDTLTETPARHLWELDLRIALGPELMAAKGHSSPEVEHTYIRARKLCQQVGETPQLFPALWGLWIFSGVNGDYHESVDLAEQLLHLAQRLQDPALLLQAHHAMWMTLYHQGDLTAVRSHCQQGTQLYDPDQHHAQTYVYGNHDPGVCARGFGCRTLWLLGCPDQARQMCGDMLTLARQLKHPLSLIQAHAWSMWVHAFCGEYQLALEQAETTVTLAAAQGIPYWVSHGTMMRGWLHVETGEVKAGLTQLYQGLEVIQSLRARSLLPWYLLLLAEVHGKQGQIDLSLRAIASGLDAVNQHEIFVCESELYRLKGELLLQQSVDNQVEAEACFHQAITIAQNQSAKSWELRAATSLARLWQSQGKRDEAREVLEPVYGWFTEGFDTADLIDAKALLDELGG